MNYYGTVEGCPGLYCGKKSLDSVDCEVKELLFAILSHIDEFLGVFLGPSAK